MDHTIVHHEKWFELKLTYFPIETQREMIYDINFDIARAGYAMA